MRTFTHPGDPALSLPLAALAGWVGRTTPAALDPLVWGVRVARGAKKDLPWGPEGLEMPTPNPLPPVRPHLPTEAAADLSASPAHLGATPVRPAEPATNALSVGWVCLFYCDSVCMG